MNKVCDVLELSFGRCENTSSAILREEGLTNPTNLQLKKAIDQVEENITPSCSYTKQIGKSIAS